MPEGKRRKFVAPGLAVLLTTFLLIDAPVINAETFVVRGNEPVMDDQQAQPQRNSDFVAIGGDKSRKQRSKPKEENCFGSDCGKEEPSGVRVYTERDLQLMGELEVLKRERRSLDKRIWQIKKELKGKIPQEKEGKAHGSNPGKNMKTQNAGGNGKQKHEKKQQSKKPKVDRVARNYGTVESRDLTRLRTGGKPVVLWSNKGALSSVQVEIRNTGSYEAKKIRVEAILPDGQIEKLNGPQELKKYGKSMYEFSGNTAVRRLGKIKIRASCSNCRD